MKVLIVVLLLFCLFKFGFPTECSDFQQPVLSEFEMNKIRKEILKQKPEVLTDYDEIDNNTCYNGIVNDDPRQVAHELFKWNQLNYQEHTVKTEDGYLLTIHRVQTKTNGPPVLINHGLFGSSIDWLLLGANSLPYLLAVQGYDVWLTNARGNFFTKHVNLSPKCREFWDFSYEEIGLYDLPATIDYILWKTGEVKLTYIGYSQGSTAFFVLTSILPEYNKKISSMIALAPMTLMKKSQSPVLRAIALNEHIARDFGQYEFAPSNELSSYLAKFLCTSTSALCKQVAFLLCGFDKNHIDVSLIPGITHQFPAGSSSKLLIHYSQGISSGLFRRFDYDDLSLNLNKYHEITPPEYPLHKVTTKVSLIYSDNDWLSNSTDVIKDSESLHESLGKIENVVYVDNYSHLDYIWAKDAGEKVYKKVLYLIKKYL